MYGLVVVGFSDVVVCIVGCVFVYCLLLNFFVLLLDRSVERRNGGLVLLLKLFCWIMVLRPEMAVNDILADLKGRGS